MKQCILNKSAQDEAELELVWSLANSKELSLPFFKCFM
jgi:hypothetical protein